MLGTIVNSLAIILGSVLGVLLKKVISEKVSNTVMCGMALCVMYIGVSGSLECTDPLMLVVSMAIGALIGETIDIDKYLNKLGNLIEGKVSKKNKESNVSKAFVTASLIFCVGAMAIIGSFNSGISGDHTVLFTKSLIDGVTSLVLASTLGIGVIFSSVMVFIIQGILTLFAGFLAPLLSDMMIANITAVGSLMIIAISLNMLKITKIKVVNLVPAMLIPPLYVTAITYIPKLFG